jgi:ribosomal protein S12 methylthiotransferase
MQIYIETLGCPKNFTDSENAAGILEEAGHIIVNNPHEAEAILVNTCGFINDAKEESIDRIFEMAAYKERGTILIVSGCLSQRYKDELYNAMPEVDIFIGVNDYLSLPEILREYKKGKRQKNFSAAEKEYLEPGYRKLLSPSYSSYLKIAEGCNNICAYCVIPTIRGGYRSRKEEDILIEAKQLAESGCKELILIAQDVTAYGIDLYGKYYLSDLLEKLCTIDGIVWIRLMYCYEDRITERLIEVMAANDKICKYIDIPIQHASDNILSLMNRRSTKTSIKNTISSLRKAMPDIHIRTTFITGFPGESEKDFKELMEFVEEIKFERLGVFTYSKEEGTQAASMKGQVREQTKIRRKEQLMALQCDISLSHNQAQIGKTIEVIVEEKEDDDSYIGRSPYDAPEIDNSVLFTSNIVLEPGDFVAVEIIDAFDYDLVGRVIRKL